MTIENRQWPFVAHDGKKWMTRTELRKWLRDNSSGDYGACADAALELELLESAYNSAFKQAMENGEKANQYRDALAKAEQDTKRSIADAVALERERCARICEEARPFGGRAWSSEQAASFDALTYAANRIRVNQNAQSIAGDGE